jgi:rhodanese-related sulfurtransferase
MSTHTSRITPEQLHAAQRRGQHLALLDVRTAAEYRAGHIPQAQLIPVQALTPNAVASRFERSTPGREETLYITCQSGVRAEQAAERLKQAGLTNLVLVEGGTQAWEQACLPLHRCSNAIALERQVQIAVGSLLVLKVFLGYSVHELFFALAAMIGAGLIVAGITRWCGMAKLIAHMPWNRSDNCREQVKA